MVRAEAAAQPNGMAPAIIHGELRLVSRMLGQCVCVTCGRVGLWDEGLAGMHTGHFVPSRRNSILYDEQNVAVQCSSCNVYQSGSQQRFRQWMVAVRGEHVVQRLEQQKDIIVTYTKEDLVDLRIAYQSRLDAAVEQMKRQGQTGAKD